MNWFNLLLKISQIWQSTSDDEFIDKVVEFYRLEYISFALKNYKFQGLDDRKYNIISNVEKKLSEVMGSLREDFLFTFKKWLSSHALTDPQLWAKSRLEDSDDDLTDIEEGLVSEYLRYTGQNGHRLDRRQIETVFGQILKEMILRKGNCQTISMVEDAYQESEQEILWTELNENGPDEFSESYGVDVNRVKSNPESVIDDIVNDKTIIDYLDNYGIDEIMSMLEYTGSKYTFAFEAYQYIIFPKWFEYWEPRGIEETREQISEVYDSLRSAKSFQEFDLAIKIAIQTSHQNGSMLDYLSSDHGFDSREIESLFSSLTAGDYTPAWDKQLREIGVSIPRKRS